MQYAYRLTHLLNRDGNAGAGSGNGNGGSGNGNPDNGNGGNDKPKPTAGGLCLTCSGFVTTLGQNRPGHFIRTGRGSVSGNDPITVVADELWVPALTIDVFGQVGTPRSVNASNTIVVTAQRAGRSSNNDQIDQCGSKGSEWVPDNVGTANVSAACRHHDQCYATKGSSKLACDIGLGMEVTFACVLSGLAPSLPAVCGMSGLGYFLGVATFGFDPYNDAQDGVRTTL